ncbi:Choline-sulfatase [Crateriforma conspicua]|uniref:Choline-sulfatase n=1 Tax=Crateriforma conspicua TaxID=2527996 RepID=A0A5C5Y2Z7_9PLAN|nr:Choline-sulfatase [Crateriforma conspicua]
MIGRILDALDESPYADNTIVVLWSDHGYHLGEKGQWGKHTLWERTSNVPFVWAGPGVAEGARTDVTVSLIDIYPTLVETCNLPAPPQELEGVSLASTLKHPSDATDRTVYLPYMVPGEYAVMNRNWRYIHYDDKNQELYNVQEDPHEWNNLATDPQYADIITKLRQSAPKKFADPEPKLNSRRDLVVEGESFRWEKGKGNYIRHPKYLPYTDPAMRQVQPK